MGRLRTAGRRFRGWVREHTVDAVLFAGLGAVAYGCSLIYVPAGVIVGGAFAALLAWMSAQPPAGEGEPPRLVERWYSDEQQEDE